MAGEIQKVKVSKAVLIAGCASGIGKVTAQRLAATGWTVYATSRDGRGLEELTAAGCRALALDANDESERSVHSCCTTSTHTVVASRAERRALHDRLRTRL